MLLIRFIYTKCQREGTQRERDRDKEGIQGGESRSQVLADKQAYNNQQINRQTGSKNNNNYNNNEICNHFGIIIHKNKLTKEVNIM